MAEVSWYEAAGHAAWLGASLPTEAQWEYAARGTQGRKFPWGPDEPTGERAVFEASSTAPVGSRGEGGQTPEGLDDMSGIVWEWYRDWYDEYPDVTELVTDPLGPTTGDGRVLRGGSFDDGANYLRAAHRNGGTPVNRFDLIGFRVVSSAACFPICGRLVRAGRQPASVLACSMPAMMWSSCSTSHNQ